MFRLQKGTSRVSFNNTLLNFGLRAILLCDTRNYRLSPKTRRLNIKIYPLPFRIKYARKSHHPPLPRDG